MPMSSRWIEPIARRLALWNRRRLHRRHQRQRPLYAEWVRRHDELDATTLAALAQRLAALPGRPVLDLLLLANEAAHTSSSWLGHLQGQLYPHWQLHVLGSAAALPQWRAAAAADTRVKLQGCHDDARPLLLHSEAPWCAWPTASETWRPHALLLLVEAALRPGDTRLVYADEDRIDAQGRRHQPWFKGDFDADALLAQDTLGRPVLWQRSALLQALAADPATPLARGHALAVAGAAGLTAWQALHVPHVLCHAAITVPCPEGGDAAAVQRHLDRHACGARAHRDPHTGAVRVHFKLPVPPPAVTLVIPTRNGLHLLRRCVHSILSRSTYPNYCIVIVDNGSDDPACLRWLAQIAKHPQVAVRRDAGPFNFAALNNDAIAAIDTEFVALVNNDIEVISRDWLQEMVSLAARPGVGAVGARLWYGDGVLQHAGVVMGLRGSAGHVPKHLTRHAGGPGARAWRLQGMAAVTAACLVVRRAHYLEVGGMDGAAFGVAYNDVDLCLKLAALGHRTLWTPHAELFHHESVSRGKDLQPVHAARLARERQALQQRWPAWIARDPYYNPNLTLDSDDLALAESPRVNLRQPWFIGAGPG